MRYSVFELDAAWFVAVVHSSGYSSIILLTHIDAIVLDEAIFSQLDKTTVIQEARVFNESPVKARHCRIILAKIIALLYQGDTLSTKEATELFFGITKLFQCVDVSGIGKACQCIILT
jgi:hypothetical protein